MEGDSVKLDSIIIDRLISVFDICDETNVGKVSVSKLFAYIDEYCSKYNIERPTADDPLRNIDPLMNIQLVLDPDNNDVEIDKSTWISAFKQRVCMTEDNNNGLSVCSVVRESQENISFDSSSIVCSTPSNQSNQASSFSWSPGANSSSPSTSDEAEFLNLKASNIQLLNRTKDLIELLEISEKALSEEQTSKEELLKDLTEKSSKIQQLAEQIQILEENLKELESTLYESEKEKEALCDELQFKEGSIRLLNTDYESLQCDHEALSRQLDIAILEKNEIVKQMDKNIKSLTDCQEIILLKDEKIVELSEEIETLNYTLNELRLQSKMSHILQNTSFDSEESEHKDELSHTLQDATQEYDNCAQDLLADENPMMDRSSFLCNAKEKSLFGELVESIQESIPQPLGSILDQNFILNDNSSLCGGQERLLLEKKSFIGGQSEEEIIKSNNTSRDMDLQPSDDFHSQSCYGLHYNENHPVDILLADLRFGSNKEAVDGPENHDSCSKQPSSSIKHRDSSLCGYLMNKALVEHSSLKEASKNYLTDSYDIVNLCTDEKIEESPCNCNYYRCVRWDTPPCLLDVAGSPLIYKKTCKCHGTFPAAYNYSNRKYYSVAAKASPYILIACAFLLSVLFATVLCTAAALEIFSETGILTFPFNGSPPKWIRFILQHLIKITEREPEPF